MKTVVSLIIFVIVILIIGSGCEESISGQARIYFEKAEKAQLDGNLKRALVYFDKADKIDPNNGEILHQRGLLKSHLRMYESSIGDINKSIGLAEHEILRNSRIANRAITYVESENFDKACQDWKFLGDQRYLNKYCK